VRLALASPCQPRDYSWNCPGLWRTPRRVFRRTVQSGGSLDSMHAILASVRSAARSISRRQPAGIERTLQPSNQRIPHRWACRLASPARACPAVRTVAWSCDLLSIPASSLAVHGPAALQTRRCARFARVWRTRPGARVVVIRHQHMRSPGRDIPPSRHRPAGRNCRWRAGNVSCDVV